MAAMFRTSAEPGATIFVLSRALAFGQGCEAAWGGRSRYRGARWMTRSPEGGLCVGSSADRWVSYRRWPGAQTQTPRAVPARPWLKHGPRVAKGQVRTAEASSSEPERYCAAWLVLSNYFLTAAAWRAVMAAALTMSSTSQPRLRSLAGLAAPWSRGPMAVAPARRSVSL